MEEINLKRLFEMQEKLDNRVMEQHGIKEDVSDFVVVAFKVEFAEFLNEHKFFKFWKVDRTPTKALLEEYVDGIHFLLSLGIRRKYSKFIHVIPAVEEIENVDLSVLSQSIFNNTLDSAGKWLQCLVDYLKFGEIVGFTPRDVEEAYVSKNSENHRRQDNHY